MGSRQVRRYRVRQGPDIHIRRAQETVNSNGMKDVYSSLLIMSNLTVLCTCQVTNCPWLGNREPHASYEVKEFYMQTDKNGMHTCRGIDLWYALPET